MDFWHNGYQAAGDKAWALAEEQYKVAIASCDQDLVELILRYMTEVDTMKSRQDWDTQEAQIYKANKDTIDSDNGYRWKNWYDWE